MTLEALLNNYPQISIADEDCNDQILKYYSESITHNKSSDLIQIPRKNFFKSLASRSDQFIVFILKNKDQQIKGITVISYRNGYIEGKSVTVGHVGDLMFSDDKELMKQWRNFFTEFLKYSEEMPEANYCKYYQASLEQENEHLKESLSQSNIEGIKFSPLTSFEMINIFGLFLKPYKLIGYKIRRAKEEDKEEIIKILNKDHRKRNFGHLYDHEFDRRLKSWENFKIKDWLICEHKKKIHAVAYTWSPKETNQVKLTKLPYKSKTLLKFLKLTPLIRLSKIPKKNSHTDILYLGQISFTSDSINNQKQKILKLFIRFLFKGKRKFSTLAYCNFSNEDLFVKSRGLLLRKKPMTLYSVHYHKEDCIKHPVSPTGNPPALDVPFLL